MINPNKYELLLKNTKIFFLNPNQFNHLIDLIKEVNQSIPNLEENIAFAVKTNKESYIVIDEQRYTELDEDYQDIIILHEMAHIIDGIEDEEEADLWCFSYLTGIQMQILRDMWESRHGRKFEKFLETFIGVKDEN